MMDGVLRVATRDDVVGLWEVRYAVTENTLTPGRISDEELFAQIEVSGRGWVVARGPRIDAFAIGNAQNGNIWALFVRPEAQGQGLGSRLNAVMVAWLLSVGAPPLWLSTGIGTRAADFYAAKGWRRAGLYGENEWRYEWPTSATRITQA